jgi:hypothetical protein
MGHREEARHHVANARQLGQAIDDPQLLAPLAILAMESPGRGPAGSRPHPASRDRLKARSGEGHPSADGAARE